MTGKYRRHYFDLGRISRIYFHTKNVKPESTSSRKNSVTEYQTKMCQEFIPLGRNVNMP